VPEDSSRFTLWATFAIAALVAITAIAGLFWAPTYARETPLWAVQAVGGDAVNLLVVVPVLLVGAIKGHRRSAAGRLVWLGALGYLLYNFVIYTLAAHFNPLFLIYCAVLGLSFYTTILSLPSLPVDDIVRRLAPRAPRRTVAILLLILATAAALAWLKEDLPASFTGRVPETVTQMGLLTNPVHVLDLSFLLPALFMTAIMLLKRKPVAHVLAPPFLVLMALISLEIAGIGVAMLWRGLAAGVAMPAFFFALALGLATLAWRCLRV